MFMKKYLMGAAALALLATGCTKDLYEGETNSKPVQSVEQQYNDAFVRVFGQPDANQTWGFGNPAGARMTRSMTSPEVQGIVQPYNEAWVANYLTTAKEPDQANTWDNYDNSTYAVNYDGEGGVNKIDWNNAEQVAERNKFFAFSSFEEQVAYALANHPSWIVYNADKDYVTNFKITGTYNGYINVAASEGIMDGGTLSHAERTIVVTGTWNMTEDQRIGSLGKIIIAKGGTVNVVSGKTLNMVNQARLVVLPGGKLTGEGTVEVNNGNAAGQENYNGGTIDVAVFNNNFGKFYNYGKFLVNEYQGGAKESNFYNHSLVAVDHFGGSTANARIFNNCQFYVKNNARIRNYEGAMGSALIVGGQLMFSSSEDGTTTPTYVGLAAGALVQAGTLYNNGTSWVGPTEGGYAVLSIGKFDYMNWQQDAPQDGGYFANNIYLVADDLSNVPDGNGYHQTDPSDAYNHSLSIAEYKFKNIVANAVGNGNVTIAEKGYYEVIPADNDFVLGEAGCTPGFKIKKDDGPNPEVLPSLHVMAEDLSASEASDFDFNDVVMDVFYVDATTVRIELLAAGGTLPLRINEDNNWEVHTLFQVPVTCMVNTGTKHHVARAPYTQYELKDYVPLTLTDKTWSKDQDEFAAQVRDQIKLEVQKEDPMTGEQKWYEITATQGEPAGKIATPVNIYMEQNEWYKYQQVAWAQYRWAWEKQNIGSLFGQWVSDPSVKWYTVKED